MDRQIDTQIDTVRKREINKGGKQQGYIQIAKWRYTYTQTKTLAQT